ncbi:chromosome partition protein smc [Knoellia sinensis KCTC 19936]|uniref:Chromosome partition protein smc n=1 Tax=Knoellia sinensis KCTC 19936 TaxID=1385520 RepID=A0A0A0J8V7_9MICO|nr:SAV_6107 family HEPN domain-containing protein [Knoellia sinensis]KGN33209.1 chromosome partition protein smc [Knoellia sinensis KCTC 19936]
MAAAPALALLEQSRQCLAEAYAAEFATARYVTSQDAAMRAAAALVAGHSRGGRSRRQDLWPLLAARAPELGEWADFFALAAVRRREVEAHAVRVSVREADDLLRAAETFVGLAGTTLGMPGADRSVRRLAAARGTA